MGDVDKASPVNIDMLVNMGEGILNAERNAWLASAAPKEMEGDGEKRSKSHASRLFFTNQSIITQNT